MADAPDRRFDAPQMVPVSAERTFQYVIAGIISLLTLLGTLIYYSVTERLRSVELYGTPITREKIAALEADNRSLQRDVLEMKADLRTCLELIRLLAREQKLTADSGKK